MQAVAAIGTARNNTAQKLDSLASFFHGNRIVFELRRLVRHGYKLMIVRCKECKRMDVFQAILNNRLGDGHAVEGTRAAAYLIENQKAPCRRMPQYI